MTETTDKINICLFWGDGTIERLACFSGNKLLSHIPELCLIKPIFKIQILSSFSLEHLIIIILFINNIHIRIIKYNLAIKIY